MIHRKVRYSTPGRSSTVLCTVERARHRGQRKPLTVVLTLITPLTRWPEPRDLTEGSKPPPASGSLRSVEALPVALTRQEAVAPLHTSSPATAPFRSIYR